MGMSGMYGPADRQESLATIHAALDAGVNLLDTGDFYSIGRNEMLIGQALRGVKRDRALVSVKFGPLRGPDGSFNGYDARPVMVKNAVAYSLARLGVDYIDIYRPARLDSNVPIEDTIGAIADLVKAGYVRHIGLSEVGPETIRRAAAVHPIVDLQIEYSLISRTPEAKIFPELESLGIAVTAYGVLSRGLLAGARPSAPNDFRSHLPRFTGDNRERNQLLVDALHRLAAARAVTPAQLAMAWVRAKSAALGVTIVPTIGARTRKQLDDALGAMTIELSPQEVAALEDALPAGAVAGSRYQDSLMKHLDSER
jgi:aryl-alcohol dehydrogenase-like predicted oxidoreductase